MSQLFQNSFLMQTRSSNLWIVLAVLLCLDLDTANAAEYKLDENLAPESAQQTPLALGSIASEAERPPRRSVLNLDFSDSAPFWRDSESELNFRIFDFGRDDGSGDLSEAFAAGTELSFTSGKLRDRFSLSATWHTSNEIDAPRGLGGTGVLAPDQSDLSVISRAYLEFDLGETAHLRMYRQDFDLPYLNRQDSRMIPNTHEGYVIRSTGERLQFIAGHINKMKKRDSERFVSMAEIAGSSNNNNGTTIAGAQYEFLNHITLGAIVQHTADLFATTYAETSYSRSLTENWGLQVAAQHTDQRSIGSEKLGRFQTYSWGLRSKLSYRGAILTAGYSEISDDSAIRKPFGGTPGFTSSMLFDFDRAGEKAWRLGLSQNFSRLGAPGVSLIVNYTDGHDAMTNTGSPLRDEKEFDVTIDFRPQQGLFQGMWLRVRYGDADRGPDADDRRDLRIILSFNFDVLR